MRHPFMIYQGDMLRTLRQERALTLRDVSARAHISLGYLSEVETARKWPGVDVVQDICDVLGVRYTDFLRSVADMVDLQAATVLEWAHDNTITDPRDRAGIPTR
jgi:transcriptional regulator with XRE-family HTH domain